MTKEVLVSISGLQMALNDVGNGDDEPIEIISAGTYFFKEGTHYVFFEEIAEGVTGVTKTQIRIHEQGSLEVMKKGLSNMQLLFEKNKNNRCYYKTPYGQLNLGICTSEIAIEETETDINVRVEYTLDVDCEPLADCIIRIRIKSKESKVTF